MKTVRDALIVASVTCGLMLLIVLAVVLQAAAINLLVCNSQAAIGLASIVVAMEYLLVVLHAPAINKGGSNDETSAE